jgi:uroporphyrinogen-III synthase
VQALPVIVLTRAAEDNAPLRRRLEARGVPVREIPTSVPRLLPPDALSEDLAAVAFASRWGVRGLAAAGLLERILAAGPLVGAVGRATAEEAVAHGAAVDLVADPPTGAALAAALDARLPPGAAVLVPCGRGEDGEIQRALRAAGRPCRPLVVYENAAPPLPALLPFPVAGVFFAAPSAATRLLAALPWLVEVPVFAIGPTTLARARALGCAHALAIGPDPEFQADALERTWRAASPPVPRPPPEESP